MVENNNQIIAAGTGVMADAAEQDKKSSGIGTGNGKKVRNEMGMTAMFDAASQISGAKEGGQQGMDEKIKEELDRYGFTVKSATDIQNSVYERKPYLVEGIITPGLNILSGNRKDGKSWLALILAIRVAGDGDFWGRPTEHGGVLYMALEDDERRIQDRMEILLEGEAAPENLYFTFGIWNKKVEPSAGIEKFIKSHLDIKFVIVDVLQKIRGVKTDNQTEYAFDYKEIGKLKQAADERGISILVITHNRKMKDNNNLLNNVSGGVGVTGAADTILMMEIKSKSENGKDAIVHILGRDVPEAAVEIRFNNENCRWEYVRALAEPGFMEIEDKYKSSPIVSIIKRLLDENNGKWSGTSSELLEYGERVTGKAVAKNEASLAREMNKFDRFFEKDSIQHIKPDSNGGKGGRIHSFIRKGEDVQEHGEYIRQVIDPDAMGNDCWIPDDMGQDEDGLSVPGDEGFIPKNCRNLYEPADASSYYENDDIEHDINMMPPRIAREEEHELPFE